MWLIDLIKKINRFFAGIINFILVAIIYFIGGLFSFLLYSLSKKEKPKATYWIKEISRKHDIKRQI